VSGAVDLAQRDGRTRWLVGMRGDEIHRLDGLLVAAKAAITGRIRGTIWRKVICRSWAEE
jgi:hypothetical protein